MSNYVNDRLHIMLSRICTLVTLLRSIVSGCVRGDIFLHLAIVMIHICTCNHVKELTFRRSKCLRTPYNGAFTVITPIKTLKETTSHKGGIISVPTVWSDSMHILF